MLWITCILLCIENVHFLSLMILCTRETYLLSVIHFIFVLEHVRMCSLLYSAKETYFLSFMLFILHQKSAMSNTKVTLLFSLIFCKRDVFALFHTCYLASRHRQWKSATPKTKATFLLSPILCKRDIFTLFYIVQKRHIYSLLCPLSCFRHRHENQQRRRRTGPRRDFESWQNRNRQDDAASQGYGGR